MIFFVATQDFATLKAMFQDLQEGKMSMEEVGKVLPWSLESLLFFLIHLDIGHINTSISMRAIGLPGVVAKRGQGPGGCRHHHL